MNEWMNKWMIRNRYVNLSLCATRQKRLNQIYMWMMTLEARARSGLIFGSKGHKAKVTYESKVSACSDTAVYRNSPSRHLERTIGGRKRRSRENFSRNIYYSLAKLAFIDIIRQPATLSYVSIVWSIDWYIQYRKLFKIIYLLTCL